MPSFCTEEAHEAWCDREGLPEDAAPEPIEDEPTERLVYCLACGFPLEDEQACPSGFCRGQQP